MLYKLPFYNRDILVDPNLSYEDSMKLSQGFEKWREEYNPYPTVGYDFQSDPETLEFNKNKMFSPAQRCQLFKRQIILDHAMSSNKQVLYNSNF